MHSYSSEVHSLSKNGKPLLPSRRMTEMNILWEMLMIPISSVKIQEL